MAALHQLENQLKEIDSCFSRQQNNGFLASKHLVAGLYLVSKDKLAWLTVVDAEVPTFEASFLAQIPPKTNYYRTNFQGLEVHHVAFQQGKKMDICLVRQFIIDLYKCICGRVCD
jgi:hypothetical protein